MKTNDIKKGMVVELNNGWFGFMADNMRCNTRMVDVDGMYREIGRVYSHDIVKAYKTKLELNSDIKVYSSHANYLVHEVNIIEHTKKQLELKSFVASY